MRRQALHLALILASLAVTAALARAENDVFTIQVVDEASERGVPLVELTTVHGLHYVSDNTGIVAIDDAELLGQSVFFHVKSHGYAYPKDGFGYAGKRFDVAPGKTGRLEIKRLNLAERLYRVTGAGLYVHQLRAGKTSPIDQPLLASQVAGCDSVQNALFQDRLFWIWGDTNRLRYPLGNFQTTAATSLLPKQGGITRPREPRVLGRIVE